MGLQMMKIWTFLEKEDQVEDMNPPRTKGEQIDDMKIPMKEGIMMRLRSMMDDSDDGLPFVYGRQYPLLRIEGITFYS